MKKLTKTTFASLFMGLALAFVAVISPLPVANVSAEPVCDPDTLTLGSGVSCAQGVGTPERLFGEGSIFTIIVNVLLFIIGAISVIMLIIGGIRYTVSAGDGNSVTAAKNTILYAIIGLIVAFLAFAVVNWVLRSITPAV